MSAINEKTENALVPRPPGAVEKAAPGTKRILSGMVADTLALANREQGAPAQSKFRIGKYEWCEPDYRQILIWAKETGLKPEEVIKRLLNKESLYEGRGLGGPDLEEPLFLDGKLLKVNFDLRLLPCGSLEWVNGLEITHLQFIGASDAIWLSDLGSLPLARLTSLNCSRLGLNHLNLTRVPQLEFLNCVGNRLKELHLSGLHWLKSVHCEDNKLTELKVTDLPNLTSLWFENNLLREMDLSEVPKLSILICSQNQISDLDLAKTPELWWIICQQNQISKLDLSQCSEVRVLKCYRNRLTRLDLSSLQELEYLDCTDNAIAKLDLSECLNLKQFYCSGNPISVLDIRGLKHLCKLERSFHTKVIMDPEQEHTVQDLVVHYQR